MKRSARIAAKESAEVQRQVHLNKLNRKKEEKEKAEQAAQAAIKANNKTSYDHNLPTLRLDLNVRNTLYKKANRLFTKDYVDQLNAIADEKPRWIRSLGEWKPHGKAADTLFRGLCEHLFAKYRMPSFLWKSLFSPQYRDIILYLAAGGSVYEAVKTEKITPPLTRKMCHELMQVVGDMDFSDAVRYVQVRSVGGSEALFNLWRRRFSGFRTRQSEIFWYSVLEWLGKNPMLASDQTPPLLDYINHRHGNDLAFSMKGRTAMALIRDMQEWHGELARIKVKSLAKGTRYPLSGFADFICDNNKNEVWTCEEILTDNALAAEGAALVHCVYSYGSMVQSGTVSIWSLRLNDVRRLTIEVRNAKREIVQVRGKYNRRAEHQEMKYLLRWANENSLSLSRWL